MIRAITLGLQSIFGSPYFGLLLYLDQLGPLRLQVGPLLPDHERQQLVLQAELGHLKAQRIFKGCVGGLVGMFKDAF